MRGSETGQAGEEEESGQVFHVSWGKRREIRSC
jgi:hypothetical protein